MIPQPPQFPPSVVLPLTGSIDSAPASAEPGYKTTEFWTMVAVSGLSALVEFQLIHITSDQVQTLAGMIGMIAPPSIYAISRGIRKHGTHG